MMNAKTEKIISLFHSLYGKDRYDYNFLIYKNSKENLKIRCIKHDEIFFQNYHSHLKGFLGCKQCSKANKKPKITRNQWILRFKKVHGEKYDYSNFDNKYGSDLISVICPEHGVFNIRKSHHVNGVGCGRCIGLHKNINDWISEFNHTHDFKYDYEQINGEIKNLTKIKIICKLHGIFEQTAKNHKRGDGCPKCHRWGITRKELINELSDIYNGFYDYSNMKYNSLKDRIDVICPEHGIFNVSIYQHLYNNSGCPYCNDVGVGFKKSRFIDIANKKFCGLSGLYLIKIHNEDEVFYKIGVTFYDIKRRFKSLKNYEYEIIKFLKGPAEMIWRLEKLILFLVRKQKYRPLKSINGGETECFKNLDERINQLINNFEENHQDFLFNYLKINMNKIDGIYICGINTIGGYLLLNCNCDKHGLFDYKVDILS